jgi:hypothetical protein
MVDGPPAAASPSSNGFEYLQGDPAALAAVSISTATALGFDTKIAWLPFFSTTVEWARFAIVR